jgi:hypothetical protein
MRQDARLEEKLRTRSQKINKKSEENSPLASAFGVQ